MKLCQNKLHTALGGLCQPCLKAKRQKYKQRERELKLKRKFGISVLKYTEMLVLQNEVCAICKLPEVGCRLAVDHDHRTGKIRGLLCKNCNIGLGNFKDTPSLLVAAADYIKAS